MYLHLDQIYADGHATNTERWTAANFYNRIIFANPHDDVIYYDGSLPVVPLQGLQNDESKWDIVTTFYNHVILISGNAIRGSDIDDATMWVPITQTSGTGNIHSLNLVVQPAVNGSVTLLTDDLPTGWADGNGGTTLIRADDIANKKSNFYTVTSISNYTSESAETIQVSQTVASGRIYLTSIVNWKADTYIKPSGATKYYRVVECSTAEGYIGSLAAAMTEPAIGSTVDITFAEDVTLKLGDSISIAENIYTQATTGLNIYQVTAMSGRVATVMRTGIGEFSSGLYPPQAGANICFQPWVKVVGVSQAIPANTAMTETYVITLNREATTGATATGDTLPIGQLFEPCQANEAFSFKGSGGFDAGPIKAAVQLSTNLYLMRNRSIQTMQYSGLPEIYTIRDEISDEGLLGKYMWVKVGNDECYFWGHKEMYKLSNGQIEPVAQQVSKKMLREEFNYTYASDGVSLAVDTYMMYHNEKDKEIWTIYKPKGSTDTGPLKIMIWNYIENSCVFDEWENYLTDGITAIGGLNFPDGSRETIVGVRKSTIANTNAGFVAYGEFAQVPIYTRLGRSIPCSAQTADLDFEDSKIWKYIDTLQLNLYIKNPNPLGSLPRPFRLYIDFGSKDNMDGTVTWVGGQWVDVSGNGNIVTAVNQRVSGRYICLKFRTDQTDIQWRLSSYILSGRKGWTY